MCSLAGRLTVELIAAMLSLTTVFISRLVVLALNSVDSSTVCREILKRVLCSRICYSSVDKDIFIKLCNSSR